jgi:hypothetical protein
MAGGSCLPRGSDGSPARPPTRISAAMFNGRTPASKREESDRTSLERRFAAVTQRYVACDGTVVNGG